MRDAQISSRQLSGAFLATIGLWCLGCALNPAPKQMYDGPLLPKEQVGIIRTGCAPEGRLNIMVLRLDGKEISDVCADFAVVPGEHQLELSAEQMAMALAAPPMTSGGILGAPVGGMSGTPQQSPQPVWRSEVPLRIACTVAAGKEVTIAGSRTAGKDWQAGCQ